MSIHEQNYVRYEGALRQGGTTAIIAWTTLRTFWSFTRTKLTLLIMSLPTLVAMVLIFIEYTVRNSQLTQLAQPGAPGVDAVLFFVQAHLVGAAILYMASGCGVIADDLRYRTFQLYFSKPLARWEYALGKFLGLFGLGALVTLLPTALCAILRVALFMRTEFAWGVASQMSLTWLMLALATAVMSAVVMGLSSLTARTGYVVLSWVGVLTVPVLLTLIVQIATKGADAANLWSLPGSVHLATRALIDDEALSVPAAAPFAVLLGLGGLGVAALARRVKTLEGVA